MSCEARYWLSDAGERMLCDDNIQYAGFYLRFRDSGNVNRHLIAVEVG